MIGGDIYVLHSSKSEKRDKTNYCSKLEFETHVVNLNSLGYLIWLIQEGIYL